MSGLALIQTTADWHVYQQSLVQQNELDFSMVQWGPGPKGYPCLVASVLVDNSRFMSCYVYPHEARRLLEAAGEAATAPSAVAASPDFEKQQRKFNQHTTALLMAVIEELEAVSITNKKRFEKVLTRALARVDQYQAEQAESLRDTLAEQSALGKLAPKRKPR